MLFITVHCEGGTTEAIPVFDFSLAGRHASLAMTVVRSLFVFVLTWLLVFSLQAQEAPRFQDEVNALVAGDSAINKKKVILFTGSSSIRFWKDISTYFPKKNILNRGFGGSEMSDLIDYVDKLIVAYKPRQIFIYEGDNDIGYGKNPDDVLKQADQLLTLIRQKLSTKVQVVFISPKPSLARWQLKDKYVYFNRQLNAWTKQQKNVAYVDVWNPMLDSNGVVRKDLFIEDGLHMNKAGYDIWANVIGPYIK